MSTQTPPPITRADLVDRVLRRYANTPHADVVAAAIRQPDNVPARDALIRAYQASDRSGRYLMAAHWVRGWLVADRPVDSAADMVAMFPDDLRN